MKYKVPGRLLCRIGGFPAGLALACLAAGCGSGTEPAAINPGERRALVEFFQATGGEDWRIRDGWLGPAGSECGWYGIECAQTGSGPTVRAIGMHRNRLSGALPASLRALAGLEILDLHSNRLEGAVPEWLAEMPALEVLRLSDNRFDGLPPRLLAASFEVFDLSGNRLEGALPAFPGPEAGGPRRLDLSRNRLTGLVPASWAGMGLGELALSGNRIDGPFPVPAGGWRSLKGLDLSANAFSGPLPEKLAALPVLKRLDLSGNAFSGPLPGQWSGLEPEVLDLADNALEGPAAEFFGRARCRLDLSGNRLSGRIGPEQLGRISGQVNLCFNPVELDQGVDPEALAGVHHGGPPRACLRPRRALASADSGTWTRSGDRDERLVVLVISPADALVYRFGRDASGRPEWWSGVGRLADGAVRVEELMRTRGRFGRGFGDFLNHQRAAGRLRIDAVESGLVVEWTGPDRQACAPAGPAWRAVHVREGGPAQACGKESGGGLTGAWYNPEAYGEGLVLELMVSGRARLFWATHAADGSGDALWLYGEGVLAGNAVEFDAMSLPDVNGAGLPVTRAWGRARLVFDGADSGWLEFESRLAGFGRGRFPVRRLAGLWRPDCSERPDAAGNHPRENGD